MIEELTDFVSYLHEEKPEIFSFNLKPSEGLHVFVEIDPETGKRTKPLLIEEVGKDKPLKEKTALEIAQYEQHIHWIDHFKAIPTKPKMQIHSANPLALKFKPNKSLDKARKAASQYVDKATSMMVEENDADAILNSVQGFTKYVKNYFWADFDEKIAPIIEQYSTDTYLFVYTNTNILDPNDYKILNERYLEQKLFNNDKYNREDNDGNTFGVSNFLNGLNDKKPFLKHYTAIQKEPSIISQETAKKIHEFEVLQNRDIFINPMPIFIDRKELNSEVIDFAKEAGERVSYREFFKQYLDKHDHKDLGNYYLLYWQYGDLADIDFVSSYDPRLKSLTSQAHVISPIIFRNEQGRSIHLNTLFDIETHVVSTLYNGGIIATEGFGNDRSVKWVNYFNELKQNEYLTSDILQKAITHRKAWFDFIYKGRIHTISPTVFKEICLTSIEDSINLSLHSESKRNGQSEVYRKLNILFSLNSLFDPKHQNFNGIDMAHEIERIVQKVQDDLLSTDTHELSNYYIDNEQEFGFLAGQIVYFLLRLSESKKNTDSLFTPFLKATNVKSLKRKIEQVLDRYQYKITGSKKVRKIMSRVLAYDPESVRYDVVKTFLIAGYYHENLIFGSNNKDEE